MKRAWFVAALSAAGCGDEIIGYLDAATAATATLDGTATAGGATGEEATGEEATGDATGEASGGTQDPLPGYVAAAFQGMIAVSFDDGRTWEEVDDPTSPVAVTHESIARGPDRIVIVGGASTLVSTDGANWQAYGDQLGYARAVAYGNGIFVSVGLGRRARSDDAVGWIDERQGLTDFDLIAIAYGEGRFVAVGPGLMMTSTDGIAWEKNVVVGPKLRNIAFGNGLFVAAGEGGHIAVTQDGQTFVSQTQDGVDYLGACFFGGEFVLLAQGVVRVSEDALDWKELAIPPSEGFDCGPDSVVTFQQTQMMRGDELLTIAPAAQVSMPPTLVRFTGQ